MQISVNMRFSQVRINRVRRRVILFPRERLAEGLSVASLISCTRDALSRRIEIENIVAT